MDSAAIDPYTLYDAVKALAALSGEWFAQTDDPKWSVRKEALDKLYALLDAPRLSTEEDYGAVVKTLKRV